MHKLPRLNGCGVSNERKYCVLYAEEMFRNVNEPFLGNMSLIQPLSFGDALTSSRKNEY